jgi:hypothetical protein
MDMELFARRQKILDNLKMSMKDLENRKILLLNELIKIEKQINKHEELRDELLGEE